MEPDVALAAFDPPPPSMINWAAMDEQFERRVVSKITRRLMPLLFLCFMAAFLDRVNVGFAKLTMLSDLGMSQAAYAAGAGIFFVGYFLFEVPSNLLLQRFGARLWIARIMVVWGLVASTMVFVRGPWSFYGLRFLLGAAEAGFFPGVIFYLTHWYPKAYRSRTVSQFMIAAVVSFVVGGPLSGWLMDHPQLGLRDWQWLFLIEGIPSLVLGFVVFFNLPDGPAAARWLTPEESGWLDRRLAAEREEVERREHLTLGQAFTDPRILLLSVVYFLGVVAAYGLDFFMPTLLAQAFPGASKSILGWLAAIPPLVTIPVMVLHGRSSDRHHEQRWHVAFAVFAQATGLLLLSLRLPAPLVVAAMTISVAGRWSFIGPFWGLPTAMLTGTAAAGGIALVNSIGNLGGQAGPVLMSLFATASGAMASGLAALASVAAACGVLVLVMPLRERPSGAPGQTAGQ
jgi:MFS transporter, ACS family, tartrate transporter